MRTRLIEGILSEELPSDLYESDFADLSGLLSGEYRPFRCGIAVIRKLDDIIMDGIRQGPTQAYYDHYNAINRELNDKTGKISGRLQSEGIRVMGIKATVDDGELDEEYFKTLRFSFSHKMVGTRSGLGWIGKTDLFVSKRFGARVRLASILIDADLDPVSQPVDRSLCGSCRICVQACPGQAANGLPWSVSTDRNDFFDPFKCRTACRKLTMEKLGLKQSLCGICMSVCPKKPSAP